MDVLGFSRKTELLEQTGRERERRREGGEKRETELIGAIGEEKVRDGRRERE